MLSLTSCKQWLGSVLAGFLVSTDDFNRDFKRNCAQLPHLRVVTLENSAKNERNYAHVCLLRVVTLDFAAIARRVCVDCVMVVRWSDGHQTVRGGFLSLSATK